MGKIDWQKDCQSAMWSMFWMTHLSEPDRKANVELLKENVARLIRMTTQKTAGQRGKKTDISFDLLDPTIMTIVCEATLLCLSGELGEMPKWIESD